jgi:TPR repeat protein
MRPTALLARGLLAAALAFVLSPARADFNDGVLALMTGDNDKALQTFVPLAETSDHAYAQYFLGRMYAEGRGVKVDHEAAAKWFRKAAEKGVQDAQFRLGGCYERGEGVPKDMEYAYGWYSVSAHIGNPKAAEALKAAALKLSATELESAQELSQEMIRKYGSVPKETSRTQ